MPTRIVNSRDINIPKGWNVNPERIKNAPHLVTEQGKGIASNYRGKSYELIAIAEYKYTALQRTGRALLGLLLCVLSIGLACIARQVRCYFTKEKISLRFILPLNPDKDIPPPPVDTPTTSEENSQDHKSSSAEASRNELDPIPDKHEDTPVVDSEKATSDNTASIPPSDARFTQKYHRAIGLDFNNDIFAKPLVYNVLEYLQNSDPKLKKSIEIWYSFYKQDPSHANLSLIDAVCAELQGGTCYGQAMNILSLLGKNNSEEITEEFLIKKMNRHHYVCYQIVHTLHIFMLNISANYVQGLHVPSAKEKLESLFPHYNNKGKESQAYKLLDSDQETLAGELSDFIKIHARNHDSAGQQQDYAVQVTLLGNQSGHAAILYYSETQGKYFWYDPYKSDFGLFSTTDCSTFMRGVAEKLVSYKDSDLVNVKFTAYKLG